MTDTPRTDALCPEPNAVPFSKAVPLLELARALERELAAVTAERDAAIQCAKYGESPWSIIATLKLQLVEIW